MKHFNQLTPAEDERLALLAEECAEVIQIVAKIQRHGYGSYHPDDPTTTNRQLLEREAGDVMAALDLLAAHGIARVSDLDTNEIETWRKAKHDKIGRYLHHQGDRHAH